jgi:hypothetical protein
MALIATMVQYPMWGSQGSPEAEPTAWSDPKPLQNAMAHVALDSALRSVMGRPMWENPAGVMLWTTGVDYREWLCCTKHLRGFIL